MSDDLKALKAELAELAARMKANHLKAAKALVNGKTQEEAYRISGGKAKDTYSAASEMLKLNPQISQYRDLVQKIAAIELLPKQVATVEQKRNMLWDIAQRCVQDIKPKTEGNGDDQEIIGFVFDSRGAISAIAELNKMDGDLAVIKTDNKHTHEHEGLTNEQLAQRIADLQRKVGAAAAS